MRRHAAPDDPLTLQHLRPTVPVKFKLGHVVLSDGPALHAGASDLAPLTTLLDAARLAGEDVSRLAEAQREAEDAAGRSLGAAQIQTPA